MEPLLIVIITFGLIFVVTASLGNGLSITMQSVLGPMREHKQLNVMLLISNFIVLPALIIGLTAIVPFEPQVKMAFAALALSAGAPFIPWLVLLTLATFIVLPLALPVVLSLLGTGATPSAWLVLWPMLLFMLLPLVVGMFIRARYVSLAQQIGPYLGPLSITFLVVHIALFLGYTCQDFISLAGGGVIAFTIVLLPLAGMLIGYLLSPPYVLSPVPAANPHRGTKIVSAVAVAQQNTGAAICCAIFALGEYTVAGDMILVGAITTIIIVMLAMAELGRGVEKKQGVAATPVPVGPVAQAAKKSK
jgi:BASS family bile acid:Na+ symporter